MTLLDEEQVLLLQILARILVDLCRPRWLHFLLPAGDALPLVLPPPRDRQVAA